MRPVWSVPEAQAFDARWLAAGVPSALLMENAGRGAAERVLAETTPAQRVRVLCGPGHNGGDGYVLARHLRCAGRQVELIAYGPSPRAGDAAQMAAAWHAVGGRTERVVPPAPAALWIDALLGTGAARPLEGELLQGALDCERARQQGARVWSLDLPTGLHPEFGTPLGECGVTAERTLTFGALKRGLRTPRGAEHAGAIEVIGLGVPCALESAGAYEMEASDVAAWVPRRRAGGHKNRNGHVLIVGGAPGKEGAPQIAAHAASRAGAGLVTVATWRPDALTALAPTAMRAPLHTPDTMANLAGIAASAWVVGPGLGLEPQAHAALAQILAECTLPMVLDADAFSYARGAPEKLRRPQETVLTPHPAELARLLGCDVPSIEGARVDSAVRAANVCHATVVLKGAHTVIATPGEAPWLSPWAVPALGVAGAGDALSGVVGALLAGGCSAAEAARAGVWLHAAAAARRVGDADRGFDACELTEPLPALLAELLRA